MAHYLVTVTPRDSSAASPQSLYLLAGPELTPQAVARLTAELLHDPVVQAANWCALAELPAGTHTGMLAEIAYKPGVTDNEAESVLEGARRLGVAGLQTVRTLRRYPLAEGEHAAERYNDLIQTVLIYQSSAEPAERQAWYEHLLETPAPVLPHVARVPIRSADDGELQRISKAGVLALDLAEMQAIRAYYASQGRDPTDGELETIAQTWSEHCSHKTFKARVRYRRRETGDQPPPAPRTQGEPENAEHKNPSAFSAASAVSTTPDLYAAYHMLEQGEVEINSLIKTFLMTATQQVLETRNSQLDPRNSNWVLSAFVDNAGIIAFTDEYEVSFKVETHNHPSALEPFGGANTGVGGVIRDVLGVSAQPIANTDVLCFGPFDMAEPPPGVLHPRRVCQGVVAGVRDYGNKLGIPTVNGAVLFDEGYTANPLVFCGTVGLAPRGRHPRNVQPGDAVVVLGGRTGRDGIHGATFSSEELTHTTAEEVGSAVQIGDPITEKKLLDVLLQARDMGLYSAITDCGAGGLSSAVGEMGAETGAVVELERVPLKYAGLQPWEIWLSEAQERMVLAVPPQHMPAFLALCESEDVEASAIGHFTDDHSLRVLHGGTPVVELGMQFLHDGRPQRVLEAIWEIGDWRLEIGYRADSLPIPNLQSLLLGLLAHPNIASKERIVRTYDHEVGGATVIKPLVGAAADGPGNAAVLQPLRHSMAGLAVGCGINPRYGRLDPYWMALACVDEALRNVVAVGGDPNQTVILDNFCWGDPRLPDRMAGLVRAAAGCYDAAVAFGTPYISGKDSLNNEYRDAAGNRVAIPPTLLISALAHVPDVRQCVTMDAKEPGNHIYLVGETRDELGGAYISDWGLEIRDVSEDHANRQSPIATIPKVDLAAARRTFAALHGAMRAGLVRACHDLSEGGLAVAAAEMAIAGELGLELSIENVELRNTSSANEFAAFNAQRSMLNAQRSILYSETPSRFLVEVVPANAAAFEAAMADVVLTRLGTVQTAPQLVVRHGTETLIDVSVADLKGAWQGGLEGSGV